MNEMEKRGYPRITMHAAVFMVQGETAYLSEIRNVSAGGVSIRMPTNWIKPASTTFRLFFILDESRILCIKAKVIHQQNNEVGLSFLPGYAIEAEQLLTESRKWQL